MTAHAAGTSPTDGPARLRSDSCPQSGTEGELETLFDTYGAATIGHSADTISERVAQEPPVVLQAFSLPA
jgi:hypothetical protein